MELLETTQEKINWSKNGESLPLKNYYLYVHFDPVSNYRHLYISKTFNFEFLHVIVSLTDQNSQPLEIKDFNLVYLDSTLIIVWCRYKM